MTRRTTPPQRCLTCHQPTHNGTRCPTCQQQHEANRADGTGRPWYQDPHYQTTRRHYQQTQPNCWICGQPPTPNDPITVDHNPPIATVTDWTTCTLHPAHRSCNSRNGATTRRGAPN